MSKKFLTPIILPAGTTSNAPLLLQSGTNLTTAAAGAVEYDGKVIYSTPAGRGVSPSMMYYRLNSDLAGVNGVAPQSIFGVGVTLVASTVYAFQIAFVFSKTAGVAQHTISLLFGGTATTNNILYSGIVNGVGVSFPTSYDTQTSSLTCNSVTSFVISPSIISAAYYRIVNVTGTVSINAGGTFIPQYVLSASPGGAYSIKAGSYFAIWPIGAAGSNTSVGPWV